MAKKSRTQKKIERIISVVIFGIALLFTIMTSLSENGYLPFQFPRWSDFSHILGKSSIVEQNPVSVHFIDVGNADCTFIKTPDHNILIDAGNDGDQDTIITYLRKYRVQKLDYVIVTHPHSDHIGGMSDVLKSFDVGELIMPQMPETVTPTTNDYKKLLQTISSKNISAVYAKPGRVIELGEATLKLLSPLDDYDSINNMSIVVKLTYKNFKTLIMGDAEQVVEDDLLNFYPADELKTDVLKVGHHGSKTSSSKMFLDAVNARIFFIPCGAGNKYGHPSKETIVGLKEYGGEIYRADYDGTVIIVTDGTEMHAVKE